MWTFQLNPYLPFYSGAYIKSPFPADRTIYLFLQPCTAPFLSVNQLTQNPKNKYKIYINYLVDLLYFKIGTLRSRSTWYLQQSFKLFLILIPFISENPLTETKLG